MNRLLVPSLSLTLPKITKVFALTVVAALRIVSAVSIVSALSIVSVVTAIPAWSMPPTIAVKLFEAYQPVDEVTIKGPVRISEPINRTIEGKNLRLVVKKNRVAVFVVADQFTNHWGNESSPSGNGSTSRSEKGATSRSENGWPTSRSGNGSSAQPLVVGSRIVLSSPSSRGLEVQRAPGLRRFYKGEIRARAASTVFSVKGEWNRKRYAWKHRARMTGIALFNVVPTKDYVASVTGSELSAGAPEEASKAIAVLAFNIVETKRPKSDVSDTTAEQAYKGNEHVTPAVEAAVAAVANKLLMNGNVVAKVFYHSTCAGSTSSGEAIFGENARGLTYLKPVKCEYCKASPFWNEKRTNIKRKVLHQIFAGALPVVRDTDAAGRPTVVVLSRNKQKGTTISGYECWLKLGRNLGWRVAPSTKFALNETKKAVSDGWYRSDEIELVSSGAGHGVGLCQWGAIGMAKEGKKYDEILRYFFPGTQLK